MNTQATMESLYIINERLKFLAGKLEQAGYQMAAEEVGREAEKLGERFSQLDGVLDDYKLDIAAVQVGGQ
ncbi:hypothetical protein ACT3RU_06820 [Halomonas sp. TP35]